MIPFREKSKIGIKRVATWYGRYERPVSSFSLVGGFIFDWFTLRRIDMLWENIWVLAHIVGIAVAMIWVHMVENQPGDEANPDKTHFWLVNILQFLFGGILSVFLVFYFRSGDLATSWPFILILVVAFLANEYLKRHFVRLTFQMSLFFLSIFSSAIYLLPVVLHRIGASMFILAGIISLFITIVYLNIIMRVCKDKFFDNRNTIFTSIAVMFVVINFLYFTNLIPPIPLSLSDSGVYYSIEKDQNDNYIAEYEPTDWKSYFKMYDDFNIGPSDSVYAYSAVFSPSALDITVVHKWQYYDEVVGKWIDHEEILLPVVGGRDGGFRTYSMKTALQSGKWRVNVETTRGQVIGRLRFNVIKTAVTPPLSLKQLD